MRWSIFSVACALVFSGCGTVTVEGVENIDCATVSTDFTSDVFPIFSLRGCSTTGCHIGSEAAGDLALDETDAAALYADLEAAAAIDANIHPAAPQTAPILAAPLRGIGEHGEGGDVFESFADSDAQTLYCWIEDGIAGP